MLKKSAGILLYRINSSKLEVLLVHPGGPYWAKKDAGVWSVPKGEFEEVEDPLEAAKREMKEETGIKIKGNFIELTPVKLKSGKMIYAWAVCGDCEAENITSNTFELEWPPKSGKREIFPEVDKAEWFTTDEAIKKINVAQVRLIEELMEIIRSV